MAQRNWLSVCLVGATFFFGGFFLENARCDQWDESNRLIGEQKFQAALDNVLAIKANLEKSGDSLEQTHALIKATQLQLGVHGYETAVRFLKTEPWPKNPAGQLLLHLYYAHSLMQYQSMYGWEIGKREQIISKAAVDLKAWTTQEITLEIQKSFDAAMMSDQALDSPIPSWYDQYIQKNNFPAGVRPSLRDAVSYMAANFFLNSQFWSAQEKNELYLVNVNELLNRPPTVRLPASNRQAHPLLRSVSWLGELRARHQQRNQSEAALEATYEIHRLIHSTVTQDSDRGLVVQSLKQIQQDSKNKTGASRWWARGQAHLAEMIEQTQEPGRLIEARAHAVHGQNFDPNGTAGAFCAPIIFQIDLKHVDLQIMTSDAAGKPSILVQSKNLSQIFFRAYHFDFEAKVLKIHENGNYLDQEYLGKIKRNDVKPVAEWSETLPPTPDFSYHRKLLTPPLKKSGTYWILASHQQDFRHDGNNVISVPFTVTNLVLQTANLRDGSLQVKVLAGDSGEAIKGAEVTLYRYQWSRSAEVAQVAKTDEEGWITFKQPPRSSGGYWNYFMVARHAGMHVLERDGLYFSAAAGDPTANGALLYSDRSVYRPEQKILWKAAAYSGSSRKGSFSTAPAGKTLRIQLMDPNHQIVEEKTVQTNRFGTASGEFKIPSGRPLGAWRLVSAGLYQGAIGINVEEYKRPTFEAEFKDAETELRLNQKALLQGGARYYFGLPVTSGTVKWRVNRTEVIPDWWAWSGYRGRGWYFVTPQTQTLASGTTTLGSDGNFRLEFTPTADVRKAKQPGTSYLFQAEVNITDESGETRSATKSFRIGFVSVESSINLKDEFFAVRDDISIPISRMTLDGKPSKGNASYKIQRIKMPAHSPLPADLPRGPESISHLPNASASDNDRFGSKDDQRRARWETESSWINVVSTWPDEQEVGGGSLQHDAEGKTLATVKGGLPSGFYRITYSTKDSRGQEFQMSRPFIVAEAKPKLPVPLIVVAKKRTVEVGETAQFLVHTGLKDQPITLEIFRAGQLIRRKLLRSSQASALLDIPVTNDDRGGFTVVASGVRDHQFFRAENSVTVPWTDRNLKLEFSTFRDKLRPGTTETFRITVKNANGNRLGVGAAEILATMYDRSLDIFAPHTLANPVSLYPSGIGALGTNLSLSSQSGYTIYGQYSGGPSTPPLIQDSLIFHANYGVGGPGNRGFRNRGKGGYEEMASMEDTMVAKEASPSRSNAPVPATASLEKKMKQESSGPRENRVDNAGSAGEEKTLRSNFSETAFFLPHLVLAADGSATMEFQVPDSVTSWKVMALALTTDLKSGNIENQTRSIKDLMVRPAVPRFLREGDMAELKVTVNNASDKELNGELTLSIERPGKTENANELFQLKAADLKKKFKVSKSSSQTLTFTLHAPKLVDIFAIRVLAKSGNLSDGELRPFPVLPSRIHLAQSRFVTLKNKDHKVMEFRELAQNDDPTRINDKLVVTVDGQLFYGVLQALPYLVDYPYECTEQTLNRFVSTGIMTSLFKKYPAIEKMAKQMSSRKERLERFDDADPNRKMTLEESPWLQAAQGDAGQDQALLRILDSKIAKQVQAKALARLKKMQLSDGSFPWFEGGKPDQYMTTYILMGFGRAQEFKVDVPKEMVTAAFGYLKGWLDSELERMMSHRCCWELITMINYTLGQFPDSSWSLDLFDQKFRTRLLDYSFVNWKAHSPLLKGYLALTLHRMGRQKDATLVWESVMDSAKSDSELGTYWATEDRSWLWYNDTIETHAFSLRALTELNPTHKKLDGLTQWLFLNKKLNHWKSTRATAEAIYALAYSLDRTGGLGGREVISVDTGTQKTQFVFEPDTYSGKKNQILIPGAKIDFSRNSKITVEKQTPGFAFASSTWHFSTEKLPLDDQGDFFNISRKYFLREQKGSQWTLRPLGEGEPIKIGDQIEVQISIHTKHEAEYVHLRDPRASGMEPENLKSGHRWDLGISWYEETRDSGSNFYFSQLPVGQYMFKYRLRANMAGHFRVGPATIQSMYAPEFNAYSAGATLIIK